MACPFRFDVSDSFTLVRRSAAGVRVRWSASAGLHVGRLFSVCVIFCDAILIDASDCDFRLLGAWSTTRSIAFMKWPTNSRMNRDDYGISSTNYACENRRY